MKRGFLPLALLAGMLTAQSTVASAQTDVTVPGGATGANVFCLQAGDINSGAFVGTYLETGPRIWEERLKAGTFKLEERKRDDLTVELFDESPGCRHPGSTSSTGQSNTSRPARGITMARIAIIY